MCRFDEQAYSADSSTPSLARRFIVERLHQALGTEAVVESLVDDAGLVVSELATNAVSAGATAITVRLAIHHDHLRVGVDDNASGRPVVRTATPDATGGRGLHIIDRLVLHWGSQPTPDGKQVWAELAVDPRTSALLDCTL